jgi:predicted glutamine amidotransferase
MCVIILKPKGELLPSRSIMRKAHEQNPDGIGYMIPYGGRVHIEKGFQGVRSLRKSIFSVLRENRIKEKEVPIAIHFRFATHGALVAENCHPFPISGNESELQALKLSCNVGAMHNGIISTVPEDKSLSDSQMYIKTCLSNLSWEELLKVSPLIEHSTIGSKWLFMNEKGNYFSTGDWRELDGSYYSNLYFNSNIFSFDFRKENRWNDWSTFELGRRKKEDDVDLMLMDEINYRDF